MMISIPAFAGRNNEEEITLHNADGSPVDFVAAGIFSARFYVADQWVDATLHDGGRIRFKPGGLAIPPKQYQAKLVVFGYADVLGTVVAGPNLPTTLLLSMAP